MKFDVEVGYSARFQNRTFEFPTNGENKMPFEDSSEADADLLRSGGQSGKYRNKTALIHPNARCKERVTENTFRAWSI